MKSYKQVVFICTGNTCRSPMAEGLLREKTEQTDIKVASRGLMVFGRNEANPFAIKVMSERGIDISRHIAKPFDKDEFSEDTLILTMTLGHKTVLIQHGCQNNVYSIKEYVGLDGDVDDPYGGNLSVYRQCADELEKLIDTIGGKLSDRNW